MMLGRLMHQQAADTSRRKYSRLGEECSASLSSKFICRVICCAWWLLAVQRWSGSDGRDFCGTAYLEL